MYLFNASLLITSQHKTSKGFKYLWALSGILLVFLVLIEPVHTASVNYYVSPYGNDSNPGTMERPWRHIAYAASSQVIKPGDTVYIRGGVYSEYIKQEVSGASGSPIIYRNYPGETPVITDDGSFRSWRWQVLDQSYIRIEGLTFKDYQSGGIQVRTIDRDIFDVAIVNCTFENQRSTDVTYYKTIQITSSTSGHAPSGVEVRDNRFINIDTGKAPVVQVDGTVYNTKIIGNVLTGSTNIAINVAGRPEIGQPENLLIKGNDVSGHGTLGYTAAGIYLDGAGKNIVIEENIVHDGTQGIKVDLEPEAANMATSQVIIRRNQIYNNSQINLVLGAEETCNQSGELKEGVAIHNTIFSSIDNIANVSFDCGRNLRWKNNIFAHMGPTNGFQYRLLNEDADTSTWVLDYNWFLNASGEVDHYKWDGHRYDTLPTFQHISNHELHSNEGDPRFEDGPNYDFRLNEDSPARNGGAPLTQTLNAGSGTLITVAEAWYFSDGLGLQDGDLIRVGANPPVRVIGVDYKNHQIRVDTAISWQANAAVNYDYAEGGPDIGAVEFVPQLSLNVMPGDGFVHLRWQVNFALPFDVTWQVQYVGAAGSSPVHISGIPNDVREYQLDNLANYSWYDVTLNAVQDDRTILSETVRVMPTDIFVFFPVVFR